MREKGMRKYRYSNYIYLADLAEEGVEG